MRFAWLLPFLVGAAIAAPTRRILLWAASNDGGPGKAQLRYAHSDAQGFAKVLSTLGGIDSSDVIALPEPDSVELLEQIRSLSLRLGQARSAGARTELLFYYSGHADADGLQLGKQHMNYRRLRLALDSLPADVRLGVLDACASGAALRTKGGVRRPAFLVDESQDLRGRALLTSSTAEESSHESDRLGGSFFTQALITGLRGAADADHDHRVTLNEAYRYAYQETLRRTAEDKAGSQHPSVDMDMAGAGDVILTDLRQPTCRLFLDTTLAGQFSLRDSSGNLVAEIRKFPGAPLELSLEPGTYEAAFLTADGSRQQSRRLDATQEWAVTDSTLASWTSASKSQDTAIATRPPQSAKDSVRTIPFNIGLMPPMDMAGEDGPRSIQNFNLELALAEAGQIRGWQLAAGMATTHGRMRGAQLAGGAVIADGDSTIGMQAAMVTTSKGAVRGAQFGLVTIARGGIRGAQFSNFASLSGRGQMVGVQMSSVFTTADSGKGMQASFVNWGGHWRGMQAGFVNGGVSNQGLEAGFVNAVGSQTGLQAGFVNSSLDHIGAQAGFVNFAYRLHGAQAGFVNVSRSVTGAQMGFVNTTDSLTGAQLGFINVSHNTLAGLPLGVFNWSSSLPWRLDLWVDENRMSVLSSVWEWKFLHSQTEFSWDAGMRDGKTLGYGSAIGVQLPSDTWILSADLDNQWIVRAGQRQQNEDVLVTNNLLRFRTVAGAWLLPRLGIFAGTGLTLLDSHDGSPENLLLASPVTPEKALNHTLHTWPSVFAGLRVNLRP
jgi:Caspase domain